MSRKRYGYTCVVCMRKLKEIRENHAPNGGITFASPGNYGSTVLDMEGMIEGCICDDCLRERAAILPLVDFQRVKAWGKRVYTGKTLADLLPSAQGEDGR